MRKKLLIVNPNQFGYHTDYYFFAYHLRADYDVHYICYDRRRDRVELAGVKVIYLPFPRLRVYRSVYFLMKTLLYIGSTEFDFVFANYFPIVALIGLLVGSKRTILDIRSGSLKRNAFSRKCGNLNIRVASMVFGTTTILSEGLASLIKLKRYAIVPLGSDSYFAGNHAFDTLRLLYVGSFHERKIEDTIDGVALFLKSNPRVTVTYDIIGFGSDRDVITMKDAIRKNRLENVVSFQGRKTPPELRPFFETCNIGVSYVPITPWYDNQPPTKTFEYILSGMICVATSTSENKRYLNETNGVLCEDNPEAFAQALGEVWKKRGCFHSDIIRSSLSEYTWDRIVQTKLRPVLSAAAV